MQEREDLRVRREMSNRGPNFDRGMVHHNDFDKGMVHHNDFDKGMVHHNDFDSGMVHYNDFDKGMVHHNDFDKQRGRQRARSQNRKNVNVQQEKHQINKSRGYSNFRKNKIHDVNQELENIQPLMSIDTNKNSENLNYYARNIIVKNHNENIQILDEDTAQDNFREISIFPRSHEDIQSKQIPFLRKIKIEEKYLNADDYLDIHFRLLREDFIRPLRKGINDFVTYRNSNNYKQCKEITVYHNVHILGPICLHNGIHYRIQFDIKLFKNFNWKDSKKLIYGSLICLSSDDFVNIYVASVSDRNIEDIYNGIIIVKFETRNDEICNLGNGVKFTMVESSTFFESYRHVLEGLQKIEEKDIPFREQILYCNKNIIEPEYLLNKKDPIYTINIKRPIISKDKENEIYKTETSIIKILDHNSWPSHNTLSLDKSQFNAIMNTLTKSLSIIQGPPGTGKTFIGLQILSNLLDNKEKWSDRKSKPILIVCYTNHALDQFLEGIYKFIQKGIVRIGNQSSSEIMSKFVLNNIKKDLRKDKNIPNNISRERNRVKKKLKKIEQIIEECAARIESSEKGIFSEKVLKDDISERHYNQLFLYNTNDRFFAIPNWLFDKSLYKVKLCKYIDSFEKNKNNFENVIKNYNKSVQINQRKQHDEIRMKRHKKLLLQLKSDKDLAYNFEKMIWNGKTLKKIKDAKSIKLLKSCNGFNDIEANNISNIWNLNFQDKCKLYKYWLDKYIFKFNEIITQKRNLYEISAKRMMKISLEEDLFIMENAVVIGMTTTAAARYRSTLNKIDCPIIVVEEAAQVLESHIITTITENCKHLILIGDHKQLRPNPAVYELSENYNLKYSLFERLILNDIPCYTLRKQHRMRPEIANFARLIYPELEDDISVNNFPNIRGLRSNVYFIEHNYEELTDNENKSPSNIHEAEYIVKLCYYLLIQGYESTNITILSPYNGQILVLKNLMGEKIFEGVQVCSIDKYQGEENNIILLSLVRSNTKNQIGFVGDDRRICVALTRARHGFYTIGNFNLFAECSDLWRKIVKKAKEDNPILMSDSLLLCCEYHPNESQCCARTANDFDQALENICLMKCNFRLNCGHHCVKACHKNDRLHLDFKCQKPCNKILCRYDHKCTKLCWEECGNCIQYVEKIRTKCKHKVIIFCSLSEIEQICLQKCEKLLDCGHLCANKCGETHSTKCNVKVEKVLNCQHKATIQCYQSNWQYKCREPCTYLLDCGHVCANICGEIHSTKCIVRVEKVFDCQHKITIQCYQSSWQYKCREPCTFPFYHHCIGTCGDCFGIRQINSFKVLQNDNPLQDSEYSQQHRQNKQVDLCACCFVS